MGYRNKDGGNRAAVRFPLEYSTPADQEPNNSDGPCGQTYQLELTKSSQSGLNPA